MSDAAAPDPSMPSKQSIAAQLQRQEIVHGDAALAAQLAEAVEVIELSSGETVFDRDGDDDSLYFILDGEVAVIVDGNPIARRTAQQHFGEMALLDPTATRSANVVSRGPSTVARISETRFSEIADRYPVLWRRLAVELGSRLRLLNADTRIPNPTPVVFVGASRNAQPTADAAADALELEGIVVRLWTGGGLYGDARFAVDSFLHQVAGSDFAVLVLGAAHGIEGDTALHDALFLTGAFMGSLGKERTVVVRPQTLQFNIPSDLLGLATVTYEPETDTPDQITDAAASLVRRRIQKLGPR